MTTTSRAIDREARLSGLRIRYRDWAGPSDDAPTLLLLHGGTSHAWSMDALASAMTDRYRVIAPHLRGHGDSEWAPGAAYHQQDFVEDLEALIDELDVGRYALLGHSLGGVIAYTHAGRRPRGLERLVIVDVGVDVRGANEHLGEWLRSLRERGFANEDEAVEALLRGMPGGDDPTVRRMQRLGLARGEDGSLSARCDPLIFDHVGTFDAAENWAQLSRIDVPTLVVRGGASAVLPLDEARRMIETIPGAAYAEVDGATHALTIEQPERFVAIVRAFL